ncbi:MAG: hypothetical protein ACHQO8_00835 [Vicinamibacterales bacterium]
MPKFLIEVPHDANIQACLHVAQVFLSSGSHFLTHADWGCADGQHSAWLIVDVDSKDEARAIVPVAFRDQAKVVGLNKFSLEQIASMMGRHGNA